MNVKKSCIAFALVAATSSSAFAATVVGSASGSGDFVVSEVSNLSVQVSPKAGLIVSDFYGQHKDIGSFLVTGSGNLAIAVNDASGPVQGDSACATLTGKNNSQNKFAVCLGASAGQYNGFLKGSIGGKEYNLLSAVNGSASGYIVSSQGQPTGVVAADTYTLTLDLVSYVQ
ncbi:hypothetical protein [Aeromonas salmonicida]